MQFWRIGDTNYSSCKFGHQMVPIAVVLNLHRLQMCPPFSAPWISYKFGFQVAAFALVPKLASQFYTTYIYKPPLNKLHFWPSIRTILHLTDFLHAHCPWCPQQISDMGWEAAVIKTVFFLSIVESRFCVLSCGCFIPAEVGFWS